MFWVVLMGTPGSEPVSSSAGRANQQTESCFRVKGGETPRCWEMLGPQAMPDKVKGKCPAVLPM